MSAVAEAASCGWVAGEEDGVSLLWTERTPRGGRWVVIDEEEFLGDANDGDWCGFELAWSPTGSGTTRGRFGTFETRSALREGISAIEEVTPGTCPAVADRVAASGFEGPGTTVGGVTTWTRAIDARRTAVLRRRIDVVSALVRWRDETEDLVATASTSPRERLEAFGPPEVIATLAVLAALDLAMLPGYVGR